MCPRIEMRCIAFTALSRIFPVWDLVEGGEVKAGVSGPANRTCEV